MTETTSGTRNRELMSIHRAIGLLILVLMAGIVPACTAGRKQPARLGKVNGVPTLMVDGQPFLIVGAQCDVWRSTPQDAKTVDFFDSYRDMNATTVGLDVLWDKCEPEQDQYDFAFLDWFVKQARSRHLKAVLHLFNSNVCGGVTDSPKWSYTPAYILSAPDKYQRMVLPYEYIKNGPPMCPNDPDTLERERRYVVTLAEHLRDTDTDRTVIMLQINNEYYFQQWVNHAYDGSVRCECRYCNAKYDPAKYKDPKDFMFHSFVDYTKVLSDAIAQVYEIPLYVNSPGWPDWSVPMFLDGCPNLDLVGCDCITGPDEPNMVSRYVQGRNVTFVAECATPNPRCRLNLDVLPYYPIVGRLGIGNLLWETGPPLTICGDPVLRKRYADAMYPIKNAQWPIAQARGTANVVGWYVVRSFVDDPNRKDPTVASEKMFVREGREMRTEDNKTFTAAIGEHRITVNDSVGGVIVSPQPGVLVIATARADLTISGPAIKTAEEGVYVGSRWKRSSKLDLQREGDAYQLHIAQPRVIRLVTGR